MRMLPSLMVAATLIACGADATTNMPSPDMRMPLNPCMNGLTDGEETDQDCGGPTCSACDTGQSCKKARDCLSMFCTNAVCDAPSCSDGVKNGTESDKDCGGSCPGCAVGKACELSTDCASMTCTNGTCALSPCMNGKVDGAETDTDCGGGTCDPCEGGKMCALGTDCKSGTCTNNVCKSELMCAAGTADCDGDAGNACEVNTNTDAKNCGGCGSVCAINMTCAKGMCSKMTTMAWMDMDSAHCTGMASATIMQIANAMPVGPATVTIVAHQAAPSMNFGDWTATFPGDTCIRKWLSLWGARDVISFGNTPVCTSKANDGATYDFWCTDGNRDPYIQLTTAGRGYNRIFFWDRPTPTIKCDLITVNDRQGFSTSQSNTSDFGSVGDFLSFSW